MKTIPEVSALLAARVKNLRKGKMALCDEAGITARTLRRCAGPCTSASGRAGSALRRRTLSSARCGRATQAHSMASPHPSRRHEGGGRRLPAAWAWLCAKLRFSCAREAVGHNPHPMPWAPWCPGHCHVWPGTCAHKVRARLQGAPRLHPPSTACTSGGVFTWGLALFPFCLFHFARKQIDHASRT